MPSTSDKVNDSNMSTEVKSKASASIERPSHLDGSNDDNVDATATTKVAEARPSAPARAAVDYSAVPWVVRPRPEIDYNFVAGAYLVGSLLALIFYVSEKIFLVTLLSGDTSAADNSTGGDAKAASEPLVGGSNEEGKGEEWKEFASGMEGMYVIFAVFLPCFLWSLVVRHFWLRGLLLTSEPSEGVVNGSCSKKEKVA